MSISVEEVLKAVDYAVKSPFVKKTRGVEHNDELSVAQEIYDSSAMLGTVKKEHESVLSVLSEVSKDPVPIMDKMAEWIKNEEEGLEKTARDAIQKYEEVPKKDESFIASCQHELDEMNAKVKAIESEIRNKYAEEYEHDKSKRKKHLIIYAVGIIFGIISFFYGLKLPFILSFFGLIAGSISLVLGPIEIFLGRLLRAPEETIQKEVDSAMASFDTPIAIVKKKMEIGFDLNSEFHKNILMAQRESDKVYSFLCKRRSEIKAYKTISKDGFKEGVSLLQKTIDNFDSLNNWAANCVRDQAQREHNEKMASIEREKLRAQEAANIEQNQALRKQNELLQRQAQAAEQQAHVAEQQAKATEEIRHRMENERYGDFLKSKF